MAHEKGEQNVAVAGRAVLKGRARRRCFTIVEVVVASMILVATFAGVHALVFQSLRMIKTTMDHYLATTLAHNRLEKMRTTLVTDLPLFVEDCVLTDGQGNPDPDGRFRRTVTVEDGPVNGVAAVTVTVELRSRDDGQFDGQRQQLTALVTDFPQKAL